ncbi:unnamed protein product [Lathyrus sativus]|nr:unnamed protein product [Lathyrus sativus]
MPISGHEESGVKSFAGQFSDLVAGVPIKKRRYPPLFRSSSPPPPTPSGEPCSITEVTDLQRKENSSTSQGSSLSNVSIAGAPIKKRRFPSTLQASSPSLEEASCQAKGHALRKEHSSMSLGSTLSTSSVGLSDTIGNPVFEEKKSSSDVTIGNPVFEEKKLSSDVTNADMGQKKSLLEPKQEKSNPETPLPTLTVVNSQEKVVLNEGNDSNLGSQSIKPNTELSLAAKEGPGISTGADVSKQIVQDTLKQESPVVSGSTSLSLSFKEHLFASVTSSEISELNPNLDKGEPVSLELSLSKEECSTHSSNTDAKSDSDTTRVNSRANWDLNTTMDAWDEGSDASSVKTSIDGLNITHNALDEKQLTTPTGMTPPTSVISVTQARIESQNRAFITSPGLQSKCVHSPDLRLSSYVQKHVEEPSRISVKLNSGNATPIVSLPSLTGTAGDANTASFRLVKPEPYDDNLKKNLKEVNTGPVGSLDIAAVKQEFIQHSVIKPSNSSVSNSKLVDSTFIKSESSHEGGQERSKTAESTATGQLSKVLPQISLSSSTSMTGSVVLNSTQVSAKGSHPAVKAVCTPVLTTSNIIGQPENSSCAEGVNVEKVCEEVSSNPEHVPLVTVAFPMVGTATELTNHGLKYSSIVTKKEIADDHDGCRLKLMNEPSDPRDSGEGCVSDEEKITLSADMLEDDSYGSDLESDDNHAVTVAVDIGRYIEDDDYEDGEVREPLVPSKVEDIICEVREVEHPDLGNYDNKPVEKGVVSNDYPTSSRVVVNDNTDVIHNEIIGKDGVNIPMHEKLGKVIDKNVCMQESLDGEKSDIAADKRPVNVLERKPLDLSERTIVSETQETVHPSHHAIDGSHVIDVQCADEVLKTTDTVRHTDFDFPKMEGYANTEDITKDACNSGNQGRIIDLSRAASSSSPGKTRPISGRSLPTRAGRDVLSDTLDGDKLYRGRDDVYIDAPHRFSRERHQDRNSRLNFGRGRGRVNNRIRGDWESEREYSGEFYNGPSQQFRGTRSKYASAIDDSDLEYNNVGPDESYVVNGRLGRKPLNDGSYIAPRRRSPAGGRDGIQMGHRNPRGVSPNSRCIGGDGSELGGMRHSEKYMRGFADTLDSVYTRPQQFEGLDGRFSRGRGRNFSSMQRRGGLSRMRSKSPVRSRSRSPGQWSSPRRRSPRRRSPDSFGGHPEMTHRRSPLYRVDRMRSPDRPVFTGERVVRRHGSPQFISRPSNDMRDIDSARDHGHPRPVISNRSPSGRILMRNNRRFDVVDHRDRADNDDEYFGGGGPMHSGRMIEHSNSEGNGEERRRFGERRGPVRTFRPPYNSANNNVGENFHLNAEDGPRQHYRFCSDESDFHERGNNLRERDFDRRMKGRTGNGPPRRTRNMDEQEESFRHGGQGWSDDGFDDISRVKRKRF